MTAFMTLALLGLTLPVPAPDSDRSEALRRLASVRISVDFSRLPLGEAVNSIRESAGLNIVLQGVDPKRPVDLTVRDVSARSVLRLILDPMELALAYRNGAFVIVPPSRIKNRARLEIYDIRALNPDLWDFPGDDFTLARALFSACIAAPEPAKPLGEDLVELIAASTGGYSWVNDPDVSIRLTNGLLIVRQTPDVHAQIRRLLGLLGRSR